MACDLGYQIELLDTVHFSSGGSGFRTSEKLQPLQVLQGGLVALIVRQHTVKIDQTFSSEIPVNQPCKPQNCVPRFPTSYHVLPFLMYITEFQSLVPTTHTSHFVYNTYCHHMLPSAAWVSSRPIHVSRRTQMANSWMKAQLEMGLETITPMCKELEPSTLTTEVNQSIYGRAFFQT